MNNITTITELLLFALGLSIVINATHIAFGKEMALNWLYEWLESKFRAKKLKDLEKENARLKKLVAELSLDKDILKEINKGNF